MTFSRIQNMFTLRDGISQDTFVGVGLPSPTFPAAFANNYGFYYNLIGSLLLKLALRGTETSHYKWG